MSGQDWAGLLLVDKPEGPTSHDIIDRVRRATGLRRVGHAGTLDPLATGLLPVLLGAATRLARFLPTSPKSYEGRLRLGLTTDSDDVTGATLARHVGPFPPAERVATEARRWLGTQRQAPPAVSARKAGGERLYRLARRGVRVEVEPREIHVARFDIAPVSGDPALFDFLVEVSGGTYVRALVRDLGTALGCGGALVALRRTAIGPMRPAPGLRLAAEGDPDPAALRSWLVPPEAMPLDLPRVSLGGADAARLFTAGTARPAEGPSSDGPCAVIGPAGVLLGVGRLEAGLLRPEVVLPRPSD